MKELTELGRGEQLFRALGYAVDRTEQWIRKAGKRRDLFGCIDFVALKGGQIGVTGVQVTTESHWRERAHKAEASADIHLWIGTGNRFVVLTESTPEILRRAVKERWHARSMTHQGWQTAHLLVHHNGRIEIDGKM